MNRSWSFSSFHSFGTNGIIWWVPQMFITDIFYCYVISNHSWWLNIHKNVKDKIWCCRVQKRLWTLIPMKDLVHFFQNHQDWINFVSKYISYSPQRPFRRKRTTHYAHDEIVTQTKILKLSLPEKLWPSSWSLGTWNLFVQVKYSIVNCLDLLNLPI